MDISKSGMRHKRGKADLYNRIYHHITCGRPSKRLPVIFILQNLKKEAKMPSKTEEYLALAQRTANGLTRYWESWTDYLTTASRLYKYPFANQLMIYAQRPDATACADYDVWNNRMNRYVRRDAKGIALLDESGGFPRLHYVSLLDAPVPEQMKYASLAEAASHLMQVLNDPESITG